MSAIQKSSAVTRALEAKCLALERENLKLHRRIAKLEADLVSARNGEIARLENTPPEKLTDEELTYLIRKSERKRGRRKNESQ